GIGAADDAHRRAFRKHPDRPEETRGDADLGAVGDHRLLGLPAAVGVEDVEREVVLLEEAGLVADLGDESLADAAAADRDLEPIPGAAGAPGRDRKRERRRDDARMPHAAPSVTPLPRANNGAAADATWQSAPCRLNERPPFDIVGPGGADHGRTTG